MNTAKGPLRAAVVGVGYLGRFHAQKYANVPGVELTAVVDISPGRAAEVSAETGGEVLTDYRRLIGRVELVSVVVPACQHYRIARDLLEAGIHVLVEKPFTETVPEGEHLRELAEKNRCVLQVGHLERFNPVSEALRARVGTPLFIEGHRLASFNPRGTDVDVVLDLMIHDIDHSLQLVEAPVERIDACGAPVLSDHTDIANARLQFENGCVANLTASRVSMKSQRRLRVFQPDAYFGADMGELKLDVIHKKAGGSIEGNQLSFAKTDMLEAEVHAFVDCVRQGGVRQGDSHRSPSGTASDGINALQTALRINERIKANPLLREYQAEFIANGVQER